MTKASHPRIAIVSHPNSGIAHYSYSLASALARLTTKNPQDIFLLINKHFSCDQIDKLEIIKIFSKHSLQFFP